MDDRLNELIQYLQLCLKQGYSETRIRHRLKQSGWDKTTVDIAFAKLFKSDEKPRALDQFAITSRNEPNNEDIIKNRIEAQDKKFTLHLAVGVMSILVIVLLIIGGWAFQAKSTNENLARQNDVNYIASAVADYVNQTGDIPQSTDKMPSTDTLNICGSNCNNGQQVSIRLSYYSKPSTTISVLKYTNNLKIPNNATVYIVPKSTCNSSNTGLGSTNDKSAAILYATQSLWGLSQKCEIVIYAL